MADEAAEGELFAEPRAKGRAERLNPMTEAGKERMSRQRDELTEQVATAAHEIEALRLRQEQLEKEKAQLEALTRKQEQYIGSKAELTELLSRDVIVLEKEHAQAVRLVELLAGMKTRFADALSELRSIEEDAWPEENYEGELNRALAIVEQARDLYRKGMAKLEAADWRTKSGSATARIAEQTLGELHGRGFLHWLKAGFAASLPAMLFLALIFVLWLFFTGIWPR